MCARAAGSLVRGGLCGQRHLHGTDCSSLWGWLSPPEILGRVAGVCVCWASSLCAALPRGTFGQPTFSKALGMLVAQALAAFFAPRPREPPLHRSGESAGSNAASRVGPGPAAGEQRQGVGKTSPTSSGIDSRREIFALGLGGKFRLPLLGFP